MLYFLTFYSFSSSSSSDCSDSYRPLLGALNSILFYSRIFKKDKVIRKKVKATILRVLANDSLVTRGKGPVVVMMCAATAVRFSLFSS